MAAGATTILTAGLGAFQLARGIKDSREAEKDFNDYDRQQLDNAYKNIQISTLGSDIQREESQRNAASLFDMLQGGGARTLVGGIPKVVGTVNLASQQIAKDLDQQFINREYAIAGDNARIEGMLENRDNMNLSAIAARAASGKQDTMAGLQGLASGAVYGAQNIDFTGKGSWNEQQAKKLFGMMNPAATPLPSGMSVPLRGLDTIYPQPQTEAPVYGGYPSTPYFPVQATPIMPDNSIREMFYDPYDDLTDKYNYSKRPWI